MNSVANYEVLSLLSGTLLYVTAYMRRWRDTITIKLDTGTSNTSCCKPTIAEDRGKGV